MCLILTSAHTRAIPVAEPVTGRCIWPTVLRTRRPGAICNAICSSSREFIRFASGRVTPINQSQRTSYLAPAA